MIDLKKDYQDYLALLAILSLGLVGFVYFGYDRRIQALVVIVTAVFYVGWGIGHHLQQKDFHLKILGEYLAIAFFAVVLLLVLLGRV